jgi:integrase/recombinase XerD
MNNDVNSNIAEKLMAHRNGFDGVYLKPTREQCFSEFSKAIQDLTISSENKNKMMIKKQKETITELKDEKDKRIAELEAKHRETQEQIKGLYELLGKD